MKSKAKGTILPLQQAEFDALPYSVQRKYFSSLERLQIQQQSSEEPTSGRSSQASSAKPRRPSLSLGIRHRRNKSEKAVQDHDISHVEIDFFLSLPEKVRKQHFSREEQEILQGRREQAFLPDEHEHDSEWAQQRFNDFHFDFSNTVDIPDRGRSRRRSSASSSVSPSQASFSRSAVQEKDQDRVSSLFYLDMMGTPVFTRRETPMADTRRTMSLTSHPVRRPVSSSMMPDPPLYNTRPFQHQRAHSSSLSGRMSAYTPTTPVFDPEATHYQDPEARKKLRMYLASPQKFDEAIEFGFPSTAGNDAATPHYQLPRIEGHARKFSRDMHTFLRDGKLSFFEDNSSENQGLESDADSVADMESPTTPSSTGLSFRLHSRQISHRKFSVDSPASSPVNSANGQLAREMTLRMTLTRPDLRADEDALYGWQGPTNSAAPKPPKDDPLALEDLVLTDDMTGTKGAFYVKPKPRGNLVSRLLKRASLKGR